MSVRKTENIIAGLVFAAVLAVYVKTMCPTLYWGDCGELATAAYNLAITHPTGYPVWCLLAKLWTYLIPHGTIIWRLNTMSAFFGALAAAACYGFIRCAGVSRSPAVTGTGMLAFSFTVWQQGLFCETYSMTAFYTCFLLFLAARWRLNGCQDRDLVSLAVAYGFAMTNHQTNTLFVPGFVGFILLTEPRLRNVREHSVRRAWLRAVGFGLMPLLFYLYLPIRAAAHPPLSWGYPQSLYDVYFHVTGRVYAVNMFHTGWAEGKDILMLWALGLGRELHWAFVPFAIAGIVALTVDKSRRPFNMLLLWMLVADVAYTVEYNIYNRYIYYIPSYIALTVLACVGLDWLWGLLKRGIDAPKQPRFALLASCCVMALPVFQAARHYNYMNLSNNWTCYDFARNVLDTMPPGSVLIDNGKDTSAFTVAYLQNIEHYRTDVTVVRRGMLAALYMAKWHKYIDAWYLKDLMSSDPEICRLFLNKPLPPGYCTTEGPLRAIIADALAKDRPVFAINPDGGRPMWNPDGSKGTIQSVLQADGECTFYGILERVYPHGKMPPPRVLCAETDQLWKHYRIRGVYDGIYLRDDYLTGIALGYAYGELAHARLALSQGEVSVAEEAYTNVTHLFNSQEAEDGLKQCASLRSRQAPASSGTAERLTAPSTAAGSGPPAAVRRKVGASAA